MLTVSAVGRGAVASTLDGLPPHLLLPEAVRPRRRAGADRCPGRAAHKPVSRSWGGSCRSTWWGAGNSRHQVWGDLILLPPLSEGV